MFHRIFKILGLLKSQVQIDVVVDAVLKLRPVGAVVAEVRWWFLPDHVIAERYYDGAVIGCQV